MAVIDVKCEAFPCDDVVTGNYLVPVIRLDPLRVRAVMVSEASPPDVKDYYYYYYYYYAEGDPLFQRTTVQAFRDAGGGRRLHRRAAGDGVLLHHGREVR